MKMIKKLSDSKIFWMIISFLVSLAVWVYVTSEETVESTKTFRNVQVELVGEETLLNLRNLVVIDSNSPTVTVEISGPRRIVNSLEAEDLIAQVDVSKLTTNFTTASFSIIFPSGVDRRNLRIVTKTPDSISFMVSTLTTRTVPVKGGFTGKAVSGYIQETPYFEPSTITLSGPEEYLNKVDHAYVTFGKEQTLQSTYSIETGYVLMDENDVPCSTDGITCSPEVIRATLPVLQVKEVPIIPNVEYKAGATAENTRIKVEPETIKLAGDSAVLSEINSIELLDNLDLSTFKNSHTVTYQIPIPNGMRNLSGVTEVTVTVEILGLGTKSFDVDQFTWTGVSDDVEVIVQSAKIPVLMRGPSSLLNRITPYLIHAEGDLSNLMDTMGDHFVTVQVSVPAIPGVGPIQEDGKPDYTVAIRLVKKDETP